MTRLAKIIAETRAGTHVTTYDEFISTSPSLRTVDAVPIGSNGATARQSSFDELVPVPSFLGPQDDMDEKNGVEDNVSDNNIADNPKLVQPEKRPSKFFKLFTFCFRGQ
ncbi:hypothetical protein IFR05_009106 [Cadophora sp. M221]|nr:hypothetical protein IFR05_009106 [Cadophora sp. M221]